MAAVLFFFWLDGKSRQLHYQYIYTCLDVLNFLILLSFQCVKIVSTYHTIIYYTQNRQTCYVSVKTSDQSAQKLQVCNDFDLFHMIFRIFISHLVGGFKHGFYFPFHIWDVILPIDELIFFKMVKNVKTTNQSYIFRFSHIQLRLAIAAS